MLDNPVHYKFCIAAIGSGSGKTTITLGLIAALKKRGLKVKPFKCGPDYIDSRFHSQVAEEPSVNLDSWMMGEKGVNNSMNKHLLGFDAFVVEGVMGLFDGINSTSIEGSTAHVAQILSLPVFLVINARGIARTIAPIVKGFVDFAQNVEIAGVIVNNVSSLNHVLILSEALEDAKLPPLVGYMLRNDEWKLPERHLGLVSESENPLTQEWIDKLGDAVESTFDIDGMLQLVEFESLIDQTRPLATVLNNHKEPIVKLGVAYDKAFNFYYQENLDLLECAGVQIVKFSPLEDEVLPNDISGIYFAGGFPEVFADQLSQNGSMINSVKEFAEAGKPIYAECGGLIYLSKSIKDHDSNKYLMCGVLPIDTKMGDRLQNFGYTEVKTTRETLWGPSGTIYKGHEFHWSMIDGDDVADELKGCEYRKLRGNQEWYSDGICVNNVFASYIHAHFASNIKMVEKFVENLIKHTPVIEGEEGIILPPYNESMQKDDIVNVTSMNLSDTLIKLNISKTLSPLFIYHFKSGEWKQLDVSADAREIKIGTNPEKADIVIEEEDADGVQLVMRLFKDKWEVVELGSNHITRFNGIKKPQQEIFGHSSCAITIGSSKIIVITPKASESRELEKGVEPFDLEENFYAITVNDSTHIFELDKIVIIGSHKHCDLYVPGEEFAAVIGRFNKKIYKSTFDTPEDDLESVAIQLNHNSKFKIGDLSYTVYLPTNIRVSVGFAVPPTFSMVKFQLYEIDEHNDLTPSFIFPTAGKSICIGRGSDSSFVLNSKNISRKHCQAIIQDVSIILSDCNSSNGTFVNNKKISKIVIKPGDIIRIGDKKFFLGYVH